MRKIIKILALTFLVGLSYLSFGQNESNAKTAGINTSPAKKIDFGLRGGVGIANITGSKDADENRKFCLCPQLGVYTGFTLNEKLQLQPELKYVRKGYNYFFKNRTETKEKYRASYLDIPISLQYKTNESFFIKGGFYLGFLLGASHVINDHKNTSTDYLNGTTFGLCVGSGIQTKSGMDFGITIDKGLSAVYSNNYKKYNFQIMLSVGIKLNKIKK
ncbi:MAG: porin family protein [Bacteroidales bacterium]